MGPSLKSIGEPADPPVDRLCSLSVRATWSLGPNQACGADHVRYGCSVAAQGCVCRTGGRVCLLKPEDRFPWCLGVLKELISDDFVFKWREWSVVDGGRNGVISACDVRQKPRVVTNYWVAHPGLPVLKTGVDHYRIDRVDRLCMVDVGRDEQLRLYRMCSSNSRRPCR